jgi:hypothetical protein
MGVKVFQVRVRVPEGGFRLQPRRHAPAPVKTGHSERRRRAMWSVLIGVAAFFGLQLGTGWAIHTERTPIRDPIYFDKVERLCHHPAFFSPGSTNRPTTLLFIGSSRTLNAVDAGAATAQLSAATDQTVEVFNFGQAGAGPVTNAVYLRRLLELGVKPDFAVIEVHPTFLAGQRPDPPEGRWLLPVRLRPEEVPLVRSLGFPAATPHVHGPRGLLAPLYEYRFVLLDRYAPFFLMNNNRLNGGHESDDFGFTRLQESIPPGDRTILLNIAHGQYGYYFDGYRPTGCGVAAIRDALDVCQAHGIRPALLLCPESTEWLGWYDAEGLKELDDLMARLGKEYGVPVIDGRRWVPDDLSGDGHHLLGPGADLFTRKLVSESLVPWIKGGAR